MTSVSERWSGALQLLGLLATVVLLVAGLRRGERSPVGTKALATTARVSLLALGDINLGRNVGQRILNGDTLYAFALAMDTLRAYDVVFANLESNISDQKGRTEHPHNNIIFTAPPAAAYALRRAGITVVSTANNHALDFGLAAKEQTIAYLDGAGIAHAGTAARGGPLYAPAIVTVRGIRLAFFAVTDVMNSTGNGWHKHVAAADTAELLPAVRRARDSVDVVIVSYHGGQEYGERVTARTDSLSSDLLRGGVGLVLGHHPHVPYGLDAVGSRIAVHSLGNFVFKQPERYWTRYSYALAAVVAKDSGRARIESIRVLPLKADYQPEFLNGGTDAANVRDRVRMMSGKEALERVAW
ncbi:MAG: CapA family protein [Bacteroidota bacterium]